MISFVRYLLMALHSHWLKL